MRFALPFTVPQGQRFVMPLAAYLDESGTNPSDPALVVAGFISTDELWTEFSAKWHQAVVVEWGLTHWHMADFEARRGEFEGWPRDAEAKRRLGYLLTLITEHAIASVAVSFPRDLFNTYFAPGPKAIERLYLMTAGEAMRQISFLPRELLPGSRIALVYESGAQGRHQVEQGFSSLSRDTTVHLNFLSLTFAKKRDFEPLQAADILAYEEFRHYPKVWGDDTRGVRYPLRRIFEKGLPHAGGVMHADYLDSIYRLLEEP
jgi:hypothetical protein